MCVIDLDRCSFWRETEPVARKTHCCAACGGPIRPGEKYTRVAFDSDGSVCSEKMCGACSEVSVRFGAEHGVTPTPSILADCLWECIDGGDREEAAEWRKGLAGIRWRNRAASRGAADTKGTL